MQGDGPWELAKNAPDHPAVRQYRGRIRRPGTITWEEHLSIYEKYAEKFGRDQSAERLAQRGGFSYEEAFELLGYEPQTWSPR